MKKSVIFVLGVFCLIIGQVSGEKLITLGEVAKPDALTVAHDYFYIQEGVSYHIYRISDYKYVRKFGKEGEGPQEFKNFAFANMMFLVPYQKDNLFINSMGKVSVFSREGVFISEKKKPSPYEMFLPFLDRFLVMGGYTKQGSTPVLAYYIADSDFIKKEPFHITDIQQGQNAGFNFPFTPSDFGIHEEKIYVVDGKEGFAINIYDKNGKFIAQIKKPYTPIKLPSEYTKKTHDWFKTSPNFKNIYPFIKERIKFRSHYPPIFQMTVDEGKMYILTNKFKTDLRECIILNLKGEEIKRVFLPLKEMYGMDFVPKYVTYKGYVYYLVDNEDDEVWELHRYKL